MDNIYCYHYFTRLTDLLFWQNLSWNTWNMHSLITAKNMQCDLVMPNSLFNPCPAKPGYTLPLQTVLIQISWLLKKPTDLDLHCLSFSMWIKYINNLDQVIWLAENWKWVWHLNLFSMRRVKIYTAQYSLSKQCIDHTVQMIEKHSLYA